MKKHDIENEPTFKAALNEICTILNAYSDNEEVPAASLFSLMLSYDQKTRDHALTEESIKKLLIPTDARDDLLKCFRLYRETIDNLLKRLQ